MYKCACIENAKENYCSEMYGTITNYNNHNHTPLPNLKVIEATNQVIPEEQAEENKVTVYTFSTQRNKSENLINKFKNLAINNIGNDLINKVANLTINDIRKNLIDKVENLTINDIGKNSNGATVSDEQVQFVGDSARISHQTLLSNCIPRIRHE